MTVAEIFAKKIRIFLQAIFNRNEDHTLFFEMLLDGVINHLGFVLRAETRQELALRFRNAELIEGALDIVGNIVPRFFAFSPSA